MYSYEAELMKSIFLYLVDIPQYIPPGDRTSLFQNKADPYLAP